ncbi:MAG: hypothetical protein DKINENOH_03077 [bacterium]|nr:hypothetical protein [bacterium]
MGRACASKMAVRLAPSGCDSSSMARNMFVPSPNEPEPKKAKAATKTQRDAKKSFEFLSFMIAGKK